MSVPDRAYAYLTIPEEYATHLGGLEWSITGDAIERWNGSTLALAEELGPLLEGVFGRPPAPPFAYVLFLFHVMRDGPDTASVEFDRLWRAFTAARGAAALPRNAGAFITELCRGLPGPAGNLRGTDVAAALSRYGLFNRPRPPLAEVPPLTPAEFAARVESRLRGFNEPALLHWLTHGSGPTAAGEELARPVESLPVRVARLLAAARRRPRLVGAAVLAAAVDAALTLPPRRRSPDALPQGGYCDVTTRGEPERLLPAQFALDGDEFVRRFAEHELLYFKREEPHAAEKPERVIVLDQGVRTWGGVRHALAAAALVLLKKDAKRVGRVRLAATSAAGLVDVTGPDVETLATLLEASDLTATPGGCLARCLREPADGPRDVILLTHPRGLAGPDVAAAARDRAPADRLFSVAVDDRGRAELAEWTDGGPVPVRSFRVDLAAAEAARVEGAAPRPPARPTCWTGDAEPVGFPFRPGLLGEPTALGFDATGEWLVVAGRDGVLHGLATDGSPPEVLPRGFLGGVALKQVDAVLGVADGVVVCGRVSPAAGTSLLCPVAPGVNTTVVSLGDPVVESGASWEHAPLPPGAGEVFVAVHYDRASGRVAAHALGPVFGLPRWSAYPDLHCVVVRGPADGPRHSGRALDLGTGGRFPPAAATDLVSRAEVSWTRAGVAGSPPHALAVTTRWSASGPAGGSPYLFLAGNAVHLRRTDPPWAPFEPMRDGLPLLAGMSVDRAVLAGSVLALALSRRGERMLVLCHGPDGRVLGEIPRPYLSAPFALSPDGRVLASLRRGPRRVEVTATASPDPPLAAAALAGLHCDPAVRLDGEPFRLSVRVGAFEHVFRVERGELAYYFSRPRDWPAAPARAGVLDPVLRYDLGRFPPDHAVASDPFVAATDRFGQVLLLTGYGRLVASFLIRREHAAVWIPGDVFWGEHALIGGPPTPGARAKIGRAILAAAREGAA